jgi:CDP-glycerol glycerophosphotransferase (TagB/SpsB family)
MLDQIDFSKFEIIYTINGRFSSNRAIVKLLQSKEVTVKIIDLASNGKYLVVDNAQSTFEHINLIDDFWHNYPAESRFHDAEEYFQAKSTAIKNKSDPWIAFMTQSPNFNLPNKKIAIFYTTTQLEFVANDDSPAGDNFINQNEALAAVYNWLIDNNWFLIVRRHPRTINTDQSVEADDLLLNLPQGQDLLIINPEDKINSYELAEKADLIISYGSSIAAEFIFENKKPVVSVGITPWFLYDKTNHLLGKRELNSIDPNFIKKSEPWIVLPWALYILKAGSNFKFVTKNKENKLVLNNVEIWLDFWPWLKSKVKK